MAVRKKEQVLTMVPSDQITFKPPFDSVSDSKLTLTNPSDKHVAFKIKTTAPQRYCVRPNAGIINPAGDAEIKVMLQPGVIDERHKFMVQSIYVSDDYNKLEGKEEKKEFVAELWKAPAENPVMSSKLICNFLQPEPVSDSQYESVIEEPAIAKVVAKEPEAIPEEPLYQHHQSVKEPPKEQKKETKKVTIRPTEEKTQNDQSEEIRRLRAELQDAMKQIEILSSAPPPSTTAQSPEQQKLFLVLLFVAFISGFVLSCLV